MPLLLSPTPAPEVPTPEAPSYEVVAVGATWTAPDGSVLNLMNEWSETAVIIQEDGVEGLGAAPRSITRQQLATGGARARWSRSEERIITLPLLLTAPDPSAFMSLRRSVTLAFTQTTPAAGVTRPGVFRVIRSDGTWREISGVYLAGLDWQDSNRQGVVYDVPVLQLLCEPWWYSAAVRELEFGVAAPRSYLNPYGTVSPDRTLGTTTVNVAGDVAAAPVWSVSGPASSVTVRYTDNGPGWTFGPIDAGETITVDVERSTVTDQTGANRIGDIDWSTSRLFTLSPGESDLVLSLAGGVAGESSIRLTYRPRWETA